MGERIHFSSARRCGHGVLDFAREGEADWVYESCGCGYYRGTRQVTCAAHRTPVPEND